VNPGEYVKLSAVAKFLGVSRRVVYYWAQQGALPGAIQFAGTWLVRRADVEQHLTQLHASRGEYIEPETQLSKPLSHKYGDELVESRRRMSNHLDKPHCFNRRVSELRRAVEAGTATDAEIAEMRAWDFWQAWRLEKPSLPPALRDRFNKRTLTIEDLAGIRRTVSRPRRS